MKKIPFLDKIPIASNLINYVDDKISNVVAEAEKEHRDILQNNVSYGLLKDIKDVNLRSGQLAASALSMFIDIIEVNNLNNYEKIKAGNH